MSAETESQPQPRPRPGGRRRARRQARSAVWWKVVAALVIVGMIVGVSVQALIRRKIQGPEFRGKIAEQLSKALKASVEVPHLDWQDKTVRLAAVTARGSSDAWFDDLRVDEISSEVHFGLFDTSLPVPMTTVSRLRLKLPSTSQIPFGDLSSARQPKTGSGGGAGSFFNKQPKLGEIRVQALELHYVTPDLQVLVKGLPVNLRRGQSDAYWAVSSHPANEQATVQVTQMAGGKLAIQDLEGRVEPSRIEVSQLEAVFLPEKPTGDVDSTLTMSGFTDDSLQQMEWQARAERVRLADWLPEDLLKRITGEALLEARLTGIPGKPDATRLEASINVSKGMVQGLPFLDVLAERTKALEFTRLELNSASAVLQLQGQAWTLRDIVLESRGLVKITGQIRGQGEQLDGVLEVGAAPGRLRSIDGAEQRVFTRAADGYLWADPPMKVWGTFANVQEDLGGRISDAWLGQKVEQVVDLATQTPLKAVETGAKAVETGVKMLETAPSIIDKGARFLDSLIPRKP